MHPQHDRSFYGDSGARWTCEWGLLFRCDCRGMRRLGILSVRGSGSGSATEHPCALTESQDDMDAPAMSQLEALVTVPLRHAQLAGRHRAGRYSDLFVCSRICFTTIISYRCWSCAHTSYTWRTAVEKVANSADALTSETLSKSSHRFDFSPMSSEMLLRPAAEQLLAQQMGDFGYAGDSDTELPSSFNVSVMNSPQAFGTGIGYPVTPPFAGRAPATPLSRLGGQNQDDVYG